MPLVLFHISKFNDNKINLTTNITDKSISLFG